MTGQAVDPMQFLDFTLWADEDDESVFKKPEVRPSQLCMETSAPQMRFTWCLADEMNLSLLFGTLDCF